MLLLEGGRVVCPLSGRDEQADVLVDGSTQAIVAVGTKLDVPAGTERLDCSGAVVGPGLVELASELCDPGYTWREDLHSGSRAAAAGGFTTVVASPRTDPVIDTPPVLRDVRVRAAAAPGARIEVAGALTVGLAGEDLAEVGLLAEAGAVALSDGSVPVANATVLRRALDYSRNFGLPIFLRPLDTSLVGKGVMNEGAASLRIGLRGEPAAAEEVGIARIIELVRLTGARVHLTHVTTARGVQQLVRARSEGLPVSGSVPARNLLLIDEDVERREYDTALRLTPPLRTQQDRACLVSALRDGALQAAFADHIPWTRVGKELEFAYAEPGSSGLESALQAVLTAMDGDAVAALRALSTGPAAILGRTPRVAEGAPADLVVFATDFEVPSHERFSKGVSDALAGVPLHGGIRATIVGGRQVFG